MSSAKKREREALIKEGEKQQAYADFYEANPVTCRQCKGSGRMFIPSENLYDSCAYCDGTGSRWHIKH